MMGTQSDSFYNKYSILYPLIDIFLKPQKKILFDQINTLPEGKLLEIGVGNGSHLKLYKKHKITGIDTSSQMLKIAEKQNYGDIQLLKMDGKELIFNDEEFDYVILSHVIAVVDNPEKLLEEVTRVLKPGGQIFILNHFTPNNWLSCVDRFFEKISNKLHFKSVFYVDEIAAIKNFILLREYHFGFASYFKLLIYTKK